MRTFSNKTCPALPLAALLLCFPLIAETYHVDSATGDDSAAGSVSAPWKTIGKVNESILKPGDRVLFRRGCIWRETLIVRRSGSSNKPVVFGAYGDGRAPVINGADAVATWAPLAENVWKADARWTPAKFAAEPELVFFEGFRGHRKSRAEELRKRLDWCWRDGVLCVWGDKEPNSAYPNGGIELAARDYGIWGPCNANADFITIEDIEVRQANHKNLHVESTCDRWSVRRVCSHHNGALGGNDKNGINIACGSGHVISECIAYESAGNNINLVQCTDCVVENCTSYDAHHHCIDIKGGFTGGTASDNTVRRNSVRLTPGIGSMEAISGIFAGLGDNMKLTNTRICHNIVRDMTGNGIHVDRYAAETCIYNNVVVNSGKFNLYLHTEFPASVKNNIGVSPAGAMMLGVVSGIHQKDIDHNCWFFAAGRLFAESSPDAAEYSLFATWQDYRAATGYDTHSIAEDPLFEDPAGGGFRLLKQSPCIDRGVSVGIQHDFAGAAIPQGAAPDLGAYESPATSHE